jgi:hypothetical protein
VVLQCTTCTTCSSTRVRVYKYCTCIVPKTAMHDCSVMDGRGDEDAGAPRDVRLKSENTLFSHPCTTTLDNKTLCCRSQKRDHAATVRSATRSSSCWLIPGLHWRKRDRNDGDELKKYERPHFHRASKTTTTPKQREPLPKPYVNAAVKEATRHCRVDASAVFPGIDDFNHTGVNEDGN